MYTKYIPHPHLSAIIGKDVNTCRKNMATEKFCLTWNDYESNLGVAFRDLREEKEFFVVTLA